MPWYSGQDECMENTAVRRIISAERLQGSVLIMFDDGKYAVYSASLLYAQLNQAEQVELDPEDVAAIVLEATRKFRSAL